MKRFIITLALAVASLTIAKADDRPVTFEKLPRAAREFITTNFPNDKVSYATVDDDIIAPDYQVVLVGTDEVTGEGLCDRILALGRTKSQQELAQLYTVADVFANPTRDEVFGLVNVEALACGTPGITFDSGGSPECYDETCGSVVACDDVDALEQEIIRICTQKPYSHEACVQKAKEFDKNQKFKEYIELYERINAAGTERN